MAHLLEEAVCWRVQMLMELGAGRAALRLIDGCVNASSPRLRTARAAAALLAKAGARAEV